MSWAGDATHTASIITISGTPATPAAWTVQTAQVPPQGKVPTYAFVASNLAVAGIGQTVWISGWLTPPREIIGALYDNLTFTITKPDGTTDTFVHATGSVAAYTVNYLPTQTGIYSVKVSYAGDRFHTSCVSAPETFTVQQEALPTYPSQPLPTGPWTWPISGEYREWYQISGAWYTPTNDKSSEGDSFNPYTTGPNSPHVLWKLQTAPAGLVGGDQGYFAVMGGMGINKYQNFGEMIFPPEQEIASCCAQGRFYYLTVESAGNGTNLPVSTFIYTHWVLWCRDQYTGELIYRRDIPANPNYSGPTNPGNNQGDYPALELTSSFKTDVNTQMPIPGTFSLWITSAGIWEIDPWTGDTLYYWPGRSGIYYNGAIYMPNFNGTANAAQAGVLTKWLTRTRTVAWTISVPLMPNKFWEDIVICGGWSAGSPMVGAIPYNRIIYTYNATTGQPIATSPDVGVYSAQGEQNDIAAYGNYYFHGIDMCVHAYSLYTGLEVWKSEPMDAPWGVFSGYSSSAGYGLLYYPSHDGNLYCYNATTGKTVWKFFCGNTTETGYGHQIPWSQIVIADGKVYFSVGEHSAPNPFPRGGKLYCCQRLHRRTHMEYERVLSSRIS